VRFVCAYSFNQVTIEGSQLMLKLVTGGANCFFAIPSHLQLTIKYLVIKPYGKGVTLKNKKKKETVTRSYISFDLINKYNKDIHNIFI